MVDSGISTYINFMLQIIATVLLHKFVVISLACFTRDALNIYSMDNQIIATVSKYISPSISQLFIIQNLSLCSIVDSLVMNIYTPN